MKRLLLLISILLLSGARIANATEPARCEYASQIVLFSQGVLEKRDQVKRFAKRRYGPDAFHLLIHYANLPPQVVRQRLEALLAERVHRADELAIAWAYGAGTAADRAWLQDRVRPDASNLMPSALRAVLNFDKGETLIGLYRDTGAKLDLLRRFSAATLIGHFAAKWPDPKKIDFAQRAAAAGFPEFGATVLFTMPRRAAYESFRSNIDLAGRDHILTPRSLFGYLLTVPNDAGPLDDIAEGLEQRRRIYRGFQLSYQMREMDLMLIVLNQTGREADVHAAAERVLNQIKVGLFDPSRDTDATYIAIYEALVAELGREAADQVLQSFDLRSSRHFRGRAREQIDWAMASTAMRDHFRGHSRGEPAHPNNLSATFPWDRWVAMAKTVRDGDFDPNAVSAADVTIAVEVLFAAGRISDAYAVILAAEIDADLSVRLLRDLAMRLDRMCAHVVALPGQAILLGGDTVFNFTR